MGLDQYLSASRYVSPYNDNETFNTLKSALDIELDTTYSITVKCTVGSWRKANAIHQWFVDNVQGGEDNCQDAYVTRDNLKELLTKCEKVLGDHELAKDLLPTSAGFFFGSTDYDEWYFTSLKDTVAIINNTLALDDGYDFSYQSSW